MITTITYGKFVEQIKKFVSNGWPDIADNYTDNEILMYVYQMLAAEIVVASTNNMKYTGFFSTPEGFITDYDFPVNLWSKDPNTGYYFVQLPEPPVNLPIGYSIQSPVFVGFGSESYPLIWVQTFQRGYGTKGPLPNFGIYCFVKNNTLFLDTQSKSLFGSGLTLRVPMLSSRSVTGNDADLINASDDQLAAVFEMVTDKLTGRLSRPQTLTNDGNTLPVGAK